MRVGVERGIRQKGAFFLGVGEIEGGEVKTSFSLPEPLRAELRRHLSKARGRVVTGVFHWGESKFIWRMGEEDLYGPNVLPLLVSLK